jgi:hypothetical protein
MKTVLRSARSLKNRPDPRALELPLDLGPKKPHTVALGPAVDLEHELSRFQEFGQQTRMQTTLGVSFAGKEIAVPTFINEFWTARQRQASRLHEISYRACFKPQLPRFFIERLTQPGDRVYDPFMGRGTTLLEAALLQRVPLGCDVNPLSLTLVRPRLNPPRLEDVALRLREIPFECHDNLAEDLLVFYHPETLRQICALRSYLMKRRSAGTFDAVDDWIAMVSVNRLTGHSAGFFSVYSLPPNQAVSVASQGRINERRQQVPPRRDVLGILLKKSRLLLADLNDSARHGLAAVAGEVILLTGRAESTPEVLSKSIQLAVTSPPFLDVVQYAADNWLRCWFLGIDAATVKLTVPKKLPVWQEIMTAVFRELQRVLKPGGHVAFEVGEVHGGRTKLEEAVLPCGVAAGLQPRLILVNDQEFTKTANCWGVANMSKGTNTNRVVLFRKE